MSSNALPGRINNARPDQVFWDLVRGVLRLEPLYEAKNSVSDEQRIKARLRAKELYWANKKNK